MKSYKLFTFATMLFAAIAALTNDAAAQKTNRNWMNFTGYQTVAVERSPVAPKYTCENSIYATANFAAPVDLSGGFYVTLATGGKVIIQEKMTVDGNPGARRTIPVQLVPDDDANIGFPEATLDYSRALLTELKPGVHTIAVAVSVGEGEDEQIAAGTFSFDNRRGCAERFERVDNLINGTNTGDAETEEPKAEPTDDTETPVAPIRPQPQQPIKPQGNNRNYVDFFNNCSDDQKIAYLYPDGTTSVLVITAGFPRSGDYPVGTKFWRGNMTGGDPFYVLPASQYTNEMDKARSAQKINLCQ